MAGWRPCMCSPGDCSVSESTAASDLEARLLEFLSLHSWLVISHAHVVGHAIVGIVVMIIHIVITVIIIVS
jgi:hypothetical protein